MNFKFLTSNKNDAFVNDKLIIIGRDDDCNIQIMADGISRHHCKIFFNEETGRYCIEDMNSTNGVKLNGKKITSADLQENDIITLHNENIQISNLTSIGTETAIISLSDIISPAEYTSVAVAPEIVPVEENPAPEQENAPKEDDLGKIADYIHNNTNNLFSGIKKTAAELPKPQKFSNKIFYVTLICVIVVIGAFFIKMKENSQPNQVSSNAPDYPLYLIYTKANITKDNIFRFRFVLENDTATFSVDDMKSNLAYGPVSVTLEKNEIDNIKLAIQNSDFFKLSPVSAGLSNGSEMEFKEIEVHYGRSHNKITLKNRPAPREFIDIEEVINIASENKNLILLSLTPQEIIEHAIQHFNSAEDKFANYETDLKYLKEAIHNYELVIQYLAGISPEPEIRKKAARQKKKAENIRQKWIKQYKAQYASMLQQENIPEAKNATLVLLDLYDANTAEYTATKNRLIKIDTIIRKMNKK